MKNQTNRIRRGLTAGTLTAALLLWAAPSVVQSAEVTLKNRTGTVLAAGPAKTKITPSQDEVTVCVEKTGGRAETQVNVYVDDVRKAHFSFSNGKFTAEKERTVTGVRGKEVRVDIVNQSIGNTFKYELNITAPKAVSSGGGDTAASKRKPASLIHFFYGDNKTSTLGQETLRLVKAMEGYDKSVLLKHETVPSWIDLSEADERNAEIKDSPTKANFIKYLKQLTDEGYFVDVYIFAHGYENRFTASSGSHSAPSDYIRSTDIKALKTKVAIRSVWGTHCYGSTLNDDWLAAGAKISSGARYVNFFPNQFKGFIKEWNKGNVSFRDAVADSNTAASRTLVHTYLLADALATKKDWGGCPFPKTILGSHDCAKDYYTKRWCDEDEWNNSMSGKENINNASVVLFGGDPGLTKNSRPTWPIVASPTATTRPLSSLSRPATPARAVAKPGRRPATAPKDLIRRPVR